MLAAGLAPSARAAIREDTVHVPVRLTTRGETVAREVALTIVRDDSRGPQPFLIVLHGRPADPRTFQAMGLQTYPANARYFAARGFVVLIPTRIGYGVTGGADVEYTGACAAKRFAPGVAAAVEETRQLLAYSARLPYVQAQRGLVVGESFGGLVATAIAAEDLPGIVGTVNFAGGDGGDGLRHPEAPCRPDSLAAKFADYGRGNRVPTLWLYSANDRLWGARYPREWFAAFVAAGGRGRFVGLPADKQNGHFVFNRNPPLWQPALESFLAELGFASPGR